MKVFDNFKSFGMGVQFFAPEDEVAYAQGKPTYGFGSIKYGDRSVYTGQIYFDGAHYNKIGYGRQDLALSTLVGLSNKRHVRAAFYIGEFDYRQTDWIYGNGVLYFVDEDNKPACFVKGFYETLNRTGDYVGEFDYSTLSLGYTKDMEQCFDNWTDVFEDNMAKFNEMTDITNLLVGDSYFEFWQYPEWCGTRFYEYFGRQGNLNLGIGGTRFCDWQRYIDRVVALPQPKRIFLNLGFNDIHCHFEPAQVYEHYKLLLGQLKQAFPNSEYYLLNIVSSPCFASYAPLEEELNNMIAKTASEFGVTIVDMRTLVAQAQQHKNMFAGDNVHLNADGYQLMAETLAKIMK